MKVKGTVYTDVYVDPLIVIEKLIEEEIGWNNWVFKVGEQHYKGFEVSAGQHSFDEEEPISKELHDYIVSLKRAKDYLLSKEVKSTST